MLPPSSPHKTQPISANLGRHYNMVGKWGGELDVGGTHYLPHSPPPASVLPDCSVPVPHPVPNINNHPDVWISTYLAL